MGDGGWAGQSRPVGDVDELSGRVDRLTTRVEAVTGLVEALHDRIAPAADDAPVTAEQLADIAARMVRLIESRLQTHNERIERAMGELLARSSRAEIDLTGAEQLALLRRLVAQVDDLAQSISSPTV